MHTLEGLRRQIETATDLGSVVTTMKTLAAVSIHQYERAVEALADYNRTIEMGFRIALREEPYYGERAVGGGRAAAIVFGSDQGMCGRFNEEIVSLFSKRAADDEGRSDWLILAVGGRGSGQLVDEGRPVDSTYSVPTSVSDITILVQEILLRVEQLRAEEGVSRLQVFFNRRVSASSYASRRHQLLPIPPEQYHRWRKEPWDSRCLPTFVTDRRQLISRLVRQYLFVSLFRACAESLASENASRIAAMQAAEKNIEERLDELHGTFHQLRQTAITEELLDVVTGFEALAKQQRNSSRGTK